MLGSMSQFLERLIQDSFYPKIGDKKPAYLVFLLAALIYLLLFVSLFYPAALLDQGGFICSLWYPPAGLTVFGILAFGWLGIILDALGSALTLLLATEWRGDQLSLEALLSGIILHPVAYGGVDDTKKRSALRNNMCNGTEQWNGNRSHTF